MRNEWPANTETVCDAPLWFGQDAVVSDFGLDGLLDEIRVWTRALSADEVRALYAADRPRFPGAAEERR